MKHLCFLPIAAAGLLAPSAASAQGAPFTVSNPGTGDETEFKIDGDYRARRDRDVATAKVELTFPVADRVELSFQMQHRQLYPRGGRTVNGIAGVSVASKFYLLKPEESALGIQIGTEPEFTLLSGNDAFGFGPGRVEFTLPIMIVKPIGSLKLGTKLAYTHRLGGEDHQALAAVLAMYRLDPMWRVGVEAAARSPQIAMDERSTDVSVGFKFDASSRFQFYGLFGEGIERPNGLAEHRARVGIRLAFGGAARRMKKAGITEL